MLDEYQKFLEGKFKVHQNSGFEIELDSINPILFPHQKIAVKKALEKGRFALFLDTGLGKTLCELEWAKHIYNHTNKPILIICPLAVSGQIIEEGKKFGYDVNRLNLQKGIETAINVINFEQLSNVDVSLFSGIVIDESSILKSFTGALRNLIIETFKDFKFKLACTATPSPNEYTEIGNHSQFIGVLDSSDMLTKFFSNDTSAASKFILKGHAKKDFFRWLNSWSLCLTKPSDLGFSDDSYNLPPLNIIEYEIFTVKKDNGKLFNDTSVNATNFNQELRNTMEARLNKVAEIVNNSTDNFIIWIKQNDEADYLKKLIPDAIEVRGSELPETKEKKLLGFGKNEFRVMITKTKIAQFGLNYQNCNNQVFASLDFSFEGTYQAIRRCYRFGQTKEVNIHIVKTDTMKNVSDIIKQKESEFNIMRKEMINELANDLDFRLKLDYTHQVVKAPDYEIHKGDSIELIDLIDDNSIDFSIYSPPFSSLYTFSDNIRDLGNCDSDEEFFQNYRFLLQKLFKKIRPGRLVAVHTKDLPMYKSRHGATGYRDFTGENLKLMEDVGFVYHSKITIWTDPVLERARTNCQRLLYKQVQSDASLSGVGTPDYLTIFRKWENIDSDLYRPVDWKNRENFPLDTWQKWASPVWFDIMRVDVLNSRIAKDSDDEKHLSPLQLGIIERAIAMWTNENETVFTPFAGIGSAIYQAVKMNRKGIGIELKDAYFNQACKNIEQAVQEKKQLTLF